MLKQHILIATLIALLLPAAADAADNKVVDRGPNGTPRIIKGDLGNLGEPRGKSDIAIKEAARNALQNILKKDFGATGIEEMIPTQVNTDMVGSVHVRFTQTLNGLPVAGAAMVLHANADGTIVGVNGEFVSGKTLPVKPGLDGNTALAVALAKSEPGLRRVTQPELTYVLGAKGVGHLAWKVTVEYNDALGPQRDIVFADSQTGELVARHPKIYYSRDLETRDCNQKTRRCNLASDSPNTIDSGDAAIDAAHNYAIATYDYYHTNHGRDSIDNAGMTLVSRVHYDRNYNNAFWDGTQMTYGDGDGVTFIPLSQDADVVAHELTHGVTERSSGLIYASESGALNEAWSDIFGAMVDRQEGATDADIWLLGEDIYTPNISGDALRDMADPASLGDPDYYPTRNYSGSCSPSRTNDYCGVHTNSGIANLAFVLLVDGGSHPRDKTSNVVTGIGHEAAADIFYAANNACLTPSSNFAAARYCTADVYGGIHQAAVHAAWDAVGVPNDPPPPPNDPIELSDGIPLDNQDAATGNYQPYTLLNVAAGSTVTCTTSCNNGDADLYLRFGSEAEANPNSTVNACGSYTSISNESCTTGAASEATTLFAGVHAYAGFTNLQITCTETENSGGVCTLAPVGASCLTSDQCCSNSCKGKPGSKTCK
ncbi:MAG: peptidase M4 family protein [Gammaproteobacteria bacterium]|jgi:vibriolysin|nr:peptidase M4 family protein [Gammaproteobacteria bacterium]